MSNTKFQNVLFLRYGQDKMSYCICIATKYLLSNKNCNDISKSRVQVKMFVIVMLFIFDYRAYFLFPILSCCSYTSPIINFNEVVWHLQETDGWMIHHCLTQEPGGRFKNTYELLNLRALKFSYVNKIHIFRCMDKIFCVEFQRYPLKFHTKYFTQKLKDMIFMQFWNFKSS